MSQDPSMIHEALAYDAFRAAGVPASRSGYAYVWLNGENFGLHLNLESLDTVSLPKIFGAPFDDKTQHLYEANEYGADFYPGKESRFEVDEGEDDTSDLTALIAAVEAAASDPLPPSLSTLVDLDEMTRMWGVEKYIGHWDGYAGEGTPGEEEFNEHRPNNYYLYSDPAGRFSMLPWGTDQTWDTRLDFEGQDGRLFDLCLEDKGCAGLFSTAVANALATVGDLDLDAQAAAVAMMLGPWQALEEAPRRPFISGQIADAVANTREFITQRPVEAAAWLAEHPPPVPPEPPVVMPPLMSTSPPSPPPPETPDPPAAAIVLGIEKGDGLIRVELRLAGPGDVALIGKSPLDGRPRGVCRDEAHANRPRDLILDCRLSPRALQRLQRHSLPVALRATFDAGGSEVTVFSRQVTLSRHH